jgi:hypothetical protein
MQGYRHLRRGGSPQTHLPQTAHERGHATQWGIGAPGAAHCGLALRAAGPWAGAWPICAVALDVADDVVPQPAHPRRPITGRCACGGPHGHHIGSAGGALLPRRSASPQRGLPQQALSGLLERPRLPPGRRPALLHGGRHQAVGGSDGLIPPRGPGPCRAGAWPLRLPVLVSPGACPLDSVPRRATPRSRRGLQGAPDLRRHTGIKHGCVHARPARRGRLDAVPQPRRGGLGRPAIRHGQPVAAQATDDEPRQHRPPLHSNRVSHRLWR